jgi:predicted dehydrogenase
MTSRKSPHAFTAVVIGARRARQGTGSFLARALAGQGVRIAAVVGTQPGTVHEAASGLAPFLGHEPRGYTSVAEALERERPNLAVIASPIEHHRAHLEAAAAAGAHALVEKPLWWGEEPDRAAITRSLVEAFSTRGLGLEVVAQWPWTLPAFFACHPELDGLPVEQFSMWLSPISRGTRMVLDSASHPLSVLEALVGAGEVEAAGAVFRVGERSAVDLAFDFVHAGGRVRSTCRLTTVPEPPRPAGLSINGRAVSRGIEAPGYNLFFEAGSRRIPVPDPLSLAVRDFVGRLQGGANLDRESLTRNMRNLEHLVVAAASAIRGGHPET